MKCIFVLLFFVTTTSSFSQSDNFSYEIKMISAGQNSPDFNPYRDSLDRLMISIHRRESAMVFQKKYNWTEQKYNSAIDKLISKNFLHLKEGRLVTSCMVITEKEGLNLIKKGRLIAKQIASQIIKISPFIKQLYETTALAKMKTFDSVSFFLLSNVLLDNWQISNVENLFLGKKDRPERHGKHYYLAYMEKSDRIKEPFGIYGNQGGRVYAVYGNNRGSINAKDVNAIAEQLPQIDSLDNIVLNKMANSFTDKLIEILVLNKQYITDIYKQTGYSNEVSFEEFFIWWYHFIYTDATNILAKKRELILPKDGNFFYRMKQ